MGVAGPPADQDVHCEDWNYCDCGMVPKCVRMYHPGRDENGKPLVDETQLALAQTPSDIAHALRDMSCIRWLFDAGWPQNVKEMIPALVSFIFIVHLVCYDLQFSTTFVDSM